MSGAAGGKGPRQEGMRALRANRLRRMEGVRGPRRRATGSSEGHRINAEKGRYVE
ncbi:MAG: hypothetical protein QXH42_09335 [Thermoplasmata archaeon]